LSDELPLAGGMDPSVGVVCVVGSRVVGRVVGPGRRPGRPLWDLAVAAQEWAPLHAPGARLHHPDDLDGVRPATPGCAISGPR
jgi:hypothetical protein